MKTVQDEELDVQHYQTFEDAQAHLQTFLEDVYKAKSLHWSLETMCLLMSLKWTLSSAHGGAVWIFRGHSNAFIVYNALAAKVDPFKYKGSVFLSLQYIGLIAGILGIAFILWNTSWVAGGVFVITFFIVLLICAKTMNRITQIQKQVYPTPPPTLQQHNL